MRILPALALVLVAACGGSDSSHQVELCASNYAFVAYRDGDGAWKTAPEPKNGRYVLPVKDDYEWVTVDVASSSGFYATYFASTVGETDAIDKCPAERTTPVDVTGMAAGSATVWIDGKQSFTPMFDLQVQPGTHDLVATDAFPDENPNGRVLIQRDLTIDGPKDVGTIDVALGQLLQNVSLTVNGGPSSVTTDVYLIDNIDDFALISVTGQPKAQVVPASILRGGDQQYIDVASNDGGADALYTGTAPTFEWPPVLTSVSLAGTSASWTTLPDIYDGVYMYAFDNNGNLQYSGASKGWIAKHHATSITFPTDVPGLMPSWIITQPTSTQVTAWYADGDTTYYSWKTSSNRAPISPRRLAQIRGTGSACGSCSSLPLH